MNGEKLLEKIELAAPAYVEAADAAQCKKMKRWRLWAAAACLCAVALAGFFALRSGGEPTTLVGGLARPYGSNVVIAGESAIEWPWEYKTLGEQYSTLHMNGAEYGGGRRTMDESWLDQALGTFELSGVDAHTGQEHWLSAEVYAIRGVSPERRVAVKLGDTCYGYANRNDTPAATLGALLDEYGLPDTLPLLRFGTYENRKEQGYYSLPDDAPIWEVLESCRDAENVHRDGWWPGDVPYVAFTATSEALGAYKQVVYVTEDGYFASNVFHSCRYFIGEDAAGKILTYVKENGTEIPRETYLNSVAGTVTAITEDWILVDDSILCRDPKDGMTFRISLQDLRIRRCVEFGNIDVGDLVVVRFTGQVDTAVENTVEGARELAEGTLYNGYVAVPE